MKMNTFLEHFGFKSLSEVSLDSRLTHFRSEDTAWVLNSLADRWHEYIRVYDMNDGKDDEDLNAR